MRRVSVSIASLLLLGALSQRAFAAENNPVITIQQVSPDLIGEWNLVYSGGTLKSTEVGINSKEHTIRPNAGPMILTLLAPGGASTRVSIFKNGTLVETKSLFQVNIMAEAGATYKLIAQYSFDKLGTIGVTSNPSKASFRLIGPNRRLFRGTAPTTFKNVPAGNYTLKMNAVKGCLLPAPIYRKLKPNERLVIEVIYRCGDDERRANTSYRARSKRQIVKDAEEREKSRAQEVTERAKAR